VQTVPVRLRVHGDRTNPHLLARINHAQRNLTSIGNQNLTKHAAPLALVFLSVIPEGNLLLSIGSTTIAFALFTIHYSLLTASLDRK
jgi:hypothetical protein